jgi:hypothetical protein
MAWTSMPAWNQAAEADGEDENAGASNVAQTNCPEDHGDQRYGEHHPIYPEPHAGQSHNLDLSGSFGKQVID